MENNTSNSESISLNKYISNTGRCSRRAADELIEEGRVKINGTVAKKGNRVESTDKVTIDDAPIGKKPKPVYLAFNKPIGIECTTNEKVEGNIISYINFSERIFPIGRLDKNSSGLILLTNDGNIVNKILRSANEHEKEYIVTVNKPITEEFIRRMSNGIPMLGTYTKKCKVVKLSKNMFKIILVQGLNRQIRRMCEFLDYRVVKLKRIRVMSIKLEDLNEGKYRKLRSNELDEIFKSTERSISNYGERKD